MSRTDKDRPYWVKRNDETLLRYIDHWHNQFGKTVYKYVPIRDAAGNPVTKKVTRTRSEPHWGRLHNGHFGITWRDITYETTEQCYEAVPLYTYVDHCTGSYDTEVTRAEREGAPCLPQLTLGGWRYDKAPKSVQRAYNRQLRTAERVNLRAYVKEVNGTDAWDDLDDSDIAARMNDFVQDYWD